MKAVDSGQNQRHRDAKRRLWQEMSIHTSKVSSIYLCIPPICIPVKLGKTSPASPLFFLAPCEIPNSS